MRETRADAARAFGYAVGLHALLFALAFVGLWWTRAHPPSAAAGAPVEAELIDASSLSAAMRQVLSERPQLPADTPPPPQPLPEPLPQDMPEPPQPIAQEQLPVPDIEEQAPESPFAEAPADVEPKEEQRRQEQVDLTEAEKQQQAQRLRRLTAMEQQRLQQLEDIRRQAAAASTEKLQQLAEQRARSAAEEAAAADAGASGLIDQALLAQYQTAIQQTVERNWTRPDSIPPGTPCKVAIVQIPGGEVISAEVAAGCPYDEVGRRSVEAAVLRAQPLPYAGFESVFRRELVFTFRAPER